MALSLFEDDDYNEHQIAWMGRDWDDVQRCADLFKEPPENEFFEIINSINDNNELNVKNKDYSKMMVEKALSQFPECIYSVYVMNLIGQNLSDQSHYNYLKTSVPKGVRRAKWAKLSQSAQDELVIKVIMLYYSINSNDAMMYRDILVSKNKLRQSLHKMKALVTDDVVKSITKNVKEQKNLKQLALEW